MVCVHGQYSSVESTIPHLIVMRVELAFGSMLLAVAFDGIVQLVAVVCQ